MLEKLQQIIRRYTDNENVSITEDTVLLADLGLNSYELAELIYEVEERFSVVITDRAIGTFKTVKNVMEYITSHE